MIKNSRHSFYSLQVCKACESFQDTIMQRDMAALAFHSLGAADFASFLLVQHGSLVDKSYSGSAAGANDPWCSYGVGVGEQARTGARDERKERRLASNRESARRARARRRRRLDELSSRAAELRAANVRLVVELNRVAASHTRAARENARLGEEARSLRERLATAEAKAADRVGDEARAPKE
ncbi:bZIP transcription factor RISBZ2-like [Phragmites australis]|uniref:bZIP transcription factor RISBZ2-like n=1 Tax=Phragmites australis TaxID=29695 RepID=UPI002D79879C|nr:bZIP transcription factor RISBZ2-like [Phragmites australis]